MARLDAGRPVPNVVPACDRCGHGCPVEQLYYDGLGHVCGACWFGRHR